jgi:iron(III) transport system substrate-binding protein
MQMTPIITSSLLAITLLIGCTNFDGNEKKVTVYVSADEQIAREIFSAFTEQTDISVDWVGDTESSKNTMLVQRLIREKNRPIADVFWSSEILGTIHLAKAGVLTPCETQRATQWPEQYRDKNFLWFGFSPRARVIAYDPQRISAEDLPQYWWEYSQAVIADPRFGTTRTHVAVMAEFPEECERLFASMEQRPMLGGNAATVQAVVDGRALFAMTDSDDVHGAIARGHSIEMYMPRHHDGKGGGTLLIPNTVSIVKGCDHPEFAATVVDFLLSDEVATMLANSPSHNIPIQLSVASQFPNLVVEDPLKVDFYSVAEQDDAQITQVMDAFSQ